jgi:undecaprenyl-diphosphatase
MGGVVERIVELVWELGHWGYLVISVGAMLECAAFVGFLVPGETLVIFGGFLAAEGILDVPQLVTVVISGAIAGDSIGYALGRHLGRPWLVRHGARFGLPRRRLDQMERLFERHGGKAILIGRFIGFLRALGPFVAGSSRMPYRRFIVWDAVGAVPWAFFFVYLGYVLAESWHIAEKWVGRVGFVAGSLTVLAVVAFVWWRRRRRLARLAPTEDATGC